MKLLPAILCATLLACAACLAGHTSTFAARKRSAHRPYRPALPIATLLALGLALAAAGALPASPDSRDPLPGTAALTPAGDLAGQMVAGIDRFLTRETDASIERRTRFWKRDFSSRRSYAASLAPNRQRLRKILGVVDERLPLPDPDDE